MAGVDKILVEYDAQTDAFERRLKAIENTLRLTAQTGKKSAKAIEVGFEAADGSLEDLEDGLKDIEKQLKKTTDPKALKELGASFKEQKKLVDASRASIKKLTGEAQAGFKKMAANVAKLGGALGIAFGVDKLVSFGVEAVELAAKAEGIKTAFERLDDPTLLNQLREATRGTISDVELMRQSVKAENFKIPLEQLGTFFEFATQRSAQTGESVDFLVDSIVGGLGRRSLRVLDNLQIPIDQLRKNLKGVGLESASAAELSKALGDVLQQEMTDAGEVTTTTAQRMQAFTAGVENAKVEVGTFLISAFDGAILAFNLLSEAISGTTKELVDLDKLREQVAETNIEGLNQLTLEIELQDELNRLEAAGMIITELVIEQTREALKIQRELTAAEAAAAAADAAQKDKETINLIKLRAELKKAKDARDEATIGSVAFVEAGETMVSIEAQIAAALGKETEAQKLARQERERAAKEREQAARELQELIEGQVADRIKAITKGAEAERASLIKLLEFEEQLAIDRAGSIGQRQKAQEDAANERATRAIAATKKNSTERELVEKQLQDELTQIAAEATQERIDIAADAARQTLDLAAQLVGLLNTLGDNELNEQEKRNQKRLDNLKAAQQGIEDNLQFQLDNRLITEQEFENKRAEQKEVFAAQEKALRDQAEREETELARKKATRDKAIAVFEIAINTAEAIIKSFAASPVTFGLPFSAIAAAAGALQLATVLSTPLPGFAKGTKDKKGSGMAMVGEKGAEAVFLPDGAKVLPNDKTVQHAGLIDAMYDNNLRNFINKNYVLPALKEQQAAQTGELAAYDDFGLKRAVTGVGKTSRGNTDRIVRAIQEGNKNPLIAASRW